MKQVTLPELQKISVEMLAQFFKAVSDRVNNQTAGGNLEELNDKESSALQRAMLPLFLVSMGGKDTHCSDAETGDIFDKDQIVEFAKEVFGLDTTDLNFGDIVAPNFVSEDKLIKDMRDNVVVTTCGKTRADLINLQENQ